VGFVGANLIFLLSFSPLYDGKPLESQPPMSDEFPAFPASQSVYLFASQTGRGAFSYPTAGGGLFGPLTPSLFSSVD